MGFEERKLVFIINFFSRRLKTILAFNTQAKLQLKESLKSHEMFILLLLLALVNDSICENPVIDGNLYFH